MLRIVQEGRQSKFVEAVEQICFSARRSDFKAASVLYVTERAVYRLTPEGIELTEVAPGIDVESQVVALMGFRPIIREIRPMNPGCFRTS